MSGESKVILYSTHDGRTEIQLRAEGGTVWLTQLEIAELFASTKQNVGMHIRNVLEDAELGETSVVKESFTTAADGKSYRTKLYRLEMILAVGYRVKGPRGIQFRQWATQNLREYLVKGFVMNDERLKNPGGWDYFDELLARIREIRASEKRFYQKVRDIYTTAVDYQSDSGQAQAFFKKVQNKMLWAVTGQTAAELIRDRANPSLPNMGLQTWQGGRVRKQDVIVAKNYLKQTEIEELDRIVVMYLDYAEDQAKRRKAMTMEEWSAKLDAFLTFNDRDVLDHPGKVSHEIAEKLAHERYDQFDGSRREAERLVEDDVDMKVVESLTEKMEANKRSVKSGGAA